MVCISCIFIPIGIWIWFEFFMPILMRVKTLVFGNTAIESDNNKEEKKEKTDLKCPFSKQQQQTESNDTKKDN
jgi:hypothetical protein